MDSLHICISCRYHADQRFLDGKRGGQILYEQLDSKFKTANLNLKIRPSECLSACRNFCALAFTGPKKTTMVFGRLDVATDPGATADALLSYAHSYCKKSDGLIMRADRPLILQDKLIARIPSPDASC